MLRMTTYVWQPRQSCVWKLVIGAVVASALTYSCRARIEPLEMRVRAEVGVQVPGELNKESVEKFLAIWSVLPYKKREEMLDIYVPERKDTEEMRNALLEYGK